MARTKRSKYINKMIKMISMLMMMKMRNTMIRNHYMKMTTCKLISRLFNNHLNSPLVTRTNLKEKRISKYVEETDDDDFLVR